MAEVKTVHEVTYDLLRALGLTTVFGNPGSTEQTFLKDWQLVGQHKPILPQAIEGAASALFGCRHGSILRPAGAPGQRPGPVA